MTPNVLSKCWHSIVPKGRPAYSIGCAPKCGTKSLHAIPCNMGNYTTPAFQRRFFIVRHPLDRFLSLYANKFLGDKGWWARHDQSLLGVRTPEQLYARIEADFRRGDQIDNHWYPQALILGDTEAQIVALEAAEELIPDFPHKNKSNSSEIVISGDLEQKVLELYKQDLDLHNLALEIGKSNGWKAIN